MANQPDFIVDPYGNAQDVRHQKPSYRFASPQKPGTKSSQHSMGDQSTPHSSQKSTKKSTNPPYILTIPIGLIIIIIAYVCKLSNTPTANSNAPMANSNAPAANSNAPAANSNAPAANSNAPAANSGFPNSYSSSSDLSLGYYAFLRGEYDIALVHFGMAIRSNPELGEAYNGRGLVHYAEGDYDAAIADFNKAIDLLPNQPSSYSNRGIVYYAKGERNRAIADFNRAIQLKPNFGKAYFNRGLTYYAEGDYDAAIADFDKAIQLSSETTHTLLNNPPSGDGNSMAGSLTDYMRLLQYEADLSSAYVGRGFAYLDKGEYDCAIADLEKALELGLDPSVEQQVRAFLATSY